MKRFFALIAVAFIATIAFADVIEKQYNFSTPEIKSIGEYQLIVFDNTLNTGIPGKPALPYASVSLLLPPGHSAQSIEIIKGEKVTLPGFYSIYPQQYSQPLSKGKRNVFVQDSELYGKNTDYPEILNGQLETEFYQGYSYGLTSITPVEYNPAKGTVSYYKTITVRITTQKDPAAQQALNLINQNSYRNNISGNLAQNPEMADSYPAHTFRDDNYQILLITPQQFAGDFDDLINLYKTRGLVTEIATTEYISGIMTGDDLQEKIRNYIIQEFTNHSIEFVLLGGDIEHIPYRGFFCQVQSSSLYEDDNIPSDLYYSGLDGTWNDNNNNLWGEIGEDDLLPDVAVGRMPFSNLTELNHMLNKSMSYQDNPVTGELNRPLLAGEHLYSNPETWGGDYLDLLIGYHDDNGYTTIGIPEDDNYEKMYEKNAPWNGNTLMDKINSGKSFIHHVGHANATYVMHLNSSDITDANFYGANGADHNYSVIFSHGCICGSFDSGDCIGEEMLKIQNFAAAFVGNSRYGWFNEGQTEGPAQHIHRELVDALYNDKLNRIGRAYMESRIETSPWVTAPGQWEEGALRWNFYCCNVLGDPMMAVWTAEPIDIQTTYDETIPIGVNISNVNITSNGLPAEGLRCTLIKDDMIYGVGVTDASGDASIELEQPFTEVGDANLVVSGYNCLPQYYPVTVIPNEGAYIVYEAYTVNDQITGNNNALVDYGESILLALDVTNVGTQTAYGVNVTIATTDEYITITDATENYGDIEGGLTVSMEDAFAFDVAQDIPDQHMVSFFVQAEASETWISNFSIIVCAPALEIGELIVDDTETGNGDGKLDPGETANLIITSMNTGHSECTGTISELITSNQYITLNNATSEVGILYPSTESDAVFNVTVDSETPLGNSIEIENTLTSGEYQISKTFFLKVGILVEDFETANFESFDWQSSSNPWTICEDDPVEGSYCAQSAPIGDQDYTDLWIQTEVLANDSVSFYFKVSSEQSYDFLNFMIDDQLIDRWSGEMGWTRVAFPVEAGEYSFKWRYEKDYYVSGGEDCAWVDYIVFPPIYIPVGEAEFEKLEFSIFPNPVSDHVRVNLISETKGDITMAIYSSHGQLVRSLSHVDKQSFGTVGFDIDMSGLQPGTYIISVATEEMQATRKIIVF